MTTEIFGIPYRLQAATDKTVCSNKIYSGVNGLYKFGCSACNRRERNKWYNICDECTKSLKEDPGIKKSLELLQERVKEIEEAAFPEANVTSDLSDPESTLGCEECGINFETAREIKKHCDEKHGAIPKVDTGDDIRDKSKFFYNEDKVSRRTHAFKHNNAYKD